MSCIYKTISLQAGEKFAIPSNGELVSVSDPTLIESTCPLPVLDEFGCYAFVFGNGEDDGDDDQIFEAANYSNTPVKGIVFNDVVYNFPSDFPATPGGGTYDLPAIITAINSTSLGTLIFDASAAINNQNDEGVMSYIVFKTTASIADNLFLNMFTYGPHIQNLYFRIPVRKYSDVSSYTNIPTCTITAT